MINATKSSFPKIQATLRSQVRQFTGDDRTKHDVSTATLRFDPCYLIFYEAEAPNPFLGDRV